MNKLKALLAGCCILVITACTSQKKVLNSYLGQTKQVVIMGFGPPMQTVSDGNGGEILVYQSTRTMPGYTSSGVATVGSDNKVYQGQSTYHQGYSVTRSIMFYINTEGKVYYWRTN